MAVDNAFARDSVFPSWFANRLQDMIGASQTAFRIRKVNSTTIGVAPPEPQSVSSITLQGLWRFRTTDVTRAHPGGSAGTYDIYAVAEDNDIDNTPDPYTDHTNYDFDLRIVTSGGTPSGPGVDVYEKVGEIDWDGAAITAIRQTADPVTGAQIQDGAISVTGGGAALARQSDGTLQITVGTATGVPFLSGAPNAWTGYQTYAANANPILSAAQTAANTVIQNKLLAADANPAWQILGDGTIKWGPGGGTAVDIALNRTGTRQLLIKPITSDSARTFEVQPSGSTTPTFTVSTSNGRVGIGLSGPSTPLDVVGQINTSTVYSIGANNALQTSGGWLLAGNGFTGTAFPTSTSHEGTNNYFNTPINLNTAAKGTGTALGSISPATPDGQGAATFLITSPSAKGTFIQPGGTTSSDHGLIAQMKSGQSSASIGLGVRNFAQSSVFAVAADGTVTITTSTAGNNLTVGGVISANRVLTVNGTGLVTIRNDNNSIVDDITLINAGISAADQGSRILFRLGNGGTPADAGAIRLLGEASWSSGANSDSYMSFSTALDGTVSESWRITSGGTLQFSNTLNPAQAINITGTIALNSDVAGLNFQPTMTGTGAVGQRGIVSQPSFNTPSGTLSEATGVRVRPTFNPTSATISNAYGTHIIPTTGSGASGVITNLYGLMIDNFSYGSVVPGSATGIKVSNVGGAAVTTVIGIDVIAQTVGTTTIGVRIAPPTGTNKVALQLSGTGTTADGGIQFGNVGDTTTLYRSASGRLQTGGDFYAVNIVPSGFVQASSTITSTSDITARNGTATAVVIGNVTGGSGISFQNGEVTFARTATSTVSLNAKIDNTTALTDPGAIIKTSGAITYTDLSTNAAVQLTNTFNGTSPATASNAYGLYVNLATGAGTGSINTFASIHAAPAYGTIKPATAKGFSVGDHGSASVTTAYGIDVAPQTNAGTTIGVRIQPPTGSTAYALQLSDTGAANSKGGIYFGTDVMIWRSAASTLKVGGVISGSGRYFSVQESGLIETRLDNNAMGDLLTLTNAQITAATQGAGILFRLGASNSPVNAGAIRMTSMDTWAAAGNRDADMVFSTTVDGTMQEAFRALSQGGLSVTALGQPTNVLTLAGTQPASVAGSGTAASAVLAATGPKGGNTSGTTGQTGGTGGAISLTGGAGGDAPGGSTNGTGGSITLTPGAAGSGAGSAGVPGVITLAGPVLVTPTSNPIQQLNVNGTTTNTSNNGAGIAYLGTQNPGSAVTSLHGIRIAGTQNATGATVTNYYGLGIALTTGSGASGVISNLNGINIGVPTFGSIIPANLAGINVADQGNASATTVFGLGITSQTGPTNNTAAVWLSGTTNSMKSGIQFRGMGNAANLYSDAGSSLTTDGSLTIAANLTMPSGVITVTNSGTAGIKVRSGASGSSSQFFIGRTADEATIVVNNSGNLAVTLLDNTKQITIDSGSAEIKIQNAKLGFFGVTPASRPSAYTPSNVTTDRSYNANSTSIDELADVLGTVIADLQSLGLLS